MSAYCASYSVAGKIYIYPEQRVRVMVRVQTATLCKRMRQSCYDFPQRVITLISFASSGVDFRIQFFVIYKCCLKSKERECWFEMHLFLTTVLYSFNTFHNLTVNSDLALILTWVRLKIVFNYPALDNGFTVETFSTSLIHPLERMLLSLFVCWWRKFWNCTETCERNASLAVRG